MSRKLVAIALLAWSFVSLAPNEARAEEPAASAAPAKKGVWVASQSAQIDASPAVIFRYTGDLTRWNDWAAWNKEKDPTGQWTYEGQAGTVGHAMSWDGPELGKGRLVITRVEGTTISYDLFFGSSKKANTGTLSVVGDAVSTVTWHTEGPARGFARLFRKKIEEMVNKDFADGLAKLEPIAEAAQAKERWAAEVAALEGRVAEAKSAAASATQKADALRAEAKAAIEAADAALAAAKKPAQKKAAGDQKAAAEAKKSESEKAAQEAAALSARASELEAELAKLKAQAPA